ncbi:hypothetical protein Pcinc_013750 [Petrolisthes cinctipes]|uniref:Uncharacterized protein n=1 Tax=Petrolisthes cinctipes TaxID=88211 RepID=A0AAE1FY35_PETCI|nr:hypothetical protein Pcinc_013750 [Petrolisthes cinctipes]
MWCGQQVSVGGQDSGIGVCMWCGQQVSLGGQDSDIGVCMWCGQQVSVGGQDSGIGVCMWCGQQVSVGGQDSGIGVCMWCGQQVLVGGWVGVRVRMEPSGWRYGRLWRPTDRPCRAPWRLIVYSLPRAICHYFIVFTVISDEFGPVALV